MAHISLLALDTVTAYNINQNTFTRINNNKIAIRLTAKLTF